MTRKGVISGILLLLSLLLVFAGATVAQQPAISLELSGVNAIDLPQVQVTANVYDALGQPLNGLTADNFRLSGPLSEVATITQVENIANNELPFGTVLVIDASESMAGAPLEQAKAAARAYIENLRETDPVALVTFGSTVRVLQEFTTDRDALLAAIDSIDLLGRTALHQAAYEGINLATDSPVPRRAMILLSDGVEYGGLSEVTPEDVIQEAFLHGVPSYTIGLGYGADRAFLERLAGETLAEFHESPTPEELQGIYQGLADRLTSQYVLTLDVQAALDGTEYPFVLTVSSGDASANQIGTVRTPIPVPIVDLSGIPTDPIRTVTDVPISVRADQEIVRVVETLGGTIVADLASEPYTLQIDPANFPPGPLTLDVSATDVEGDTGTTNAILEIAALPPQVSLSRDLSELGAINEPIEITVNAGGQTPVTEIRYSLNGSEWQTLEAPYTFTLDPLQLPPGDNHVDVEVTNEGGLQTTYSADFIIADVPPAVSVEGVSEGQSVDAPISFQINADGQTPVAEITVTVNGVPLEPVDGVYTLDPMTIPPGPAELSVSVITDQGQTGEASVTLDIAPLTPVVSVEGLDEGQTVTGDINITLDAEAQTPVIHGMVMVNGSDVAHPVQLPATITLPFSTMQPGENAVEISVDTAAGQNGRLSLTFIVPAGLFTPTPTNTPTPNQTATAQAVAQAAATRTAVANVALDAASTQAAGTQIAATEGAQAGATQSAVTAQAQAVSTQSAITQAAATQGAVTTQAQVVATQSASTQTAATQSAVTAAAESQSTAQASTQSANTAVAQAASPVPATAAPSATAQPASATPVPATATARATSDAPATVQAAAAFVQQAATNARATVSVQQSATAAAQASAQAVATQSAQVTQNAVVTQAAQATQSAAENVANATATAQAAVTQAAQTNQTATALAESISTATQQAGRTATQQAQATQSARVEASATANANRAATAEAATQAARTAEAQALAQTASAEASRAAATAGAQATRTARAELAAQTATAAVTAAPSATTEITAEAQAADATHTPQPTLTPVEVESESGGGGATTGLWAIFIVIILIAVGVVLWITRARKRRFDQP